MKQKKGMEETPHINVIYKEAMFGEELSFVSRYMYLETSYNEGINSYFRNNHDAAERILGKSFIYLPAILDNVERIVDYNRPNANPLLLAKARPDAAWVHDTCRELLSYMIDNEDDMPELPLQTDESPMLMRREREVSSGIVFKLFPLRYENDVQFGQLLKDISCVGSPDTGVRFSTIIEVNEGQKGLRHSRIREGEPVNVADYGRIDVIADEIRQRIEQLKLMGVSEFVIRKLIDLPEAKLSKLLITSNFRIVLPDYNDMEITMPTLSKVVYFFYLRHPEGLSFKELAGHREELMAIYVRISNRDDLGKMKRSIDELVDCTRNSINEKCSRIRAAFVSQFSDDLAKNYYITVGSGNAKRITLDRRLVMDETGILTNKL